MQARDIFTVRFLDHEPSLTDLMSVFPFDVSSAVLGTAVVDETDVERVCKSLPDPRRAEIQRVADLMLSADRMDKDDIEKLASQSGVTFSSAMSRPLLKFVAVS
jgi:hypothetical protein